MISLSNDKSFLNDKFMISLAVKMKGLEGFYEVISNRITIFEFILLEIFMVFFSEKYLCSL